MIDRDPWVLELSRNDGSALRLAGTSTLADPNVLPSTVLPLSFRLIAGAERPVIEVTTTGGSGRWEV